MTSVVATPPASQAELVELLQTELANEDSLYVSFAGSGELPKVFELVSVLHSRNFSRSRGGGYVAEAYDLAIRVEVFKPGRDTAAEADARVWTLIDTIDAVLRENDYRGYATKEGDLATVDEALDPYDKGWVAARTALFAVEALQSG